MKQCPFCAEDIQDTAIKCRYCSEWFSDIAHPCKGCNKLIRKTDEICQFCGYRITPEISEPLPSLENNQKKVIERVSKSKKHNVSASDRGSGEDRKKPSAKQTIKINFPKISIIDAAAERVHQYIISNTWIFHPEIRIKTIYSIASIRNIISRCYGYESYQEIKENLSNKKPQYNSLSQIEINESNDQQLKILGSAFKIPFYLAKNLWMAMTPSFNLEASSVDLKIGQIGRHEFQWKNEHEYRCDYGYYYYYDDMDNADDKEDIEKYIVCEYVIAVECPRCKGQQQTLEIEQHDIDEDPVYRIQDCSLCYRKGVYYYPQKNLNSIKLTKDEYWRWWKWHQDMEGEDERAESERIEYNKIELKNRERKNFIGYRDEACEDDIE